MTDAHHEKPAQTGVEHTPAPHLRHAHIDTKEGVVLGSVVGEKESNLGGAGRRSRM